jgi:N-acetylmuramoyl-L-alanine amidase
MSCSEASLPQPPAASPTVAPFFFVLGPPDAPLPDLPPPVPDIVPEPPAPASPLHNRRICLDPGHDTPWNIGASARGTPVHPTERVPLVEHELTLRVAYRLKDLLETEGAAVCVTRTSPPEGGRLQIDPYDFSGDGRVRPIGLAIEDVPEVIQPRIDWANAFEAELLVSIHFNGSDDPRTRGTEVYYPDTGPRQDDGRRLAQSLLDGLLEEMRDAGYEPIDRGARSDHYQRYTPPDMARILANNAATIRANGHNPTACVDCYRLLTLGNNPMARELGRYLGAVVEIEFLSNPNAVEAFILRPDSLDVIARGLLRGLMAFVNGSD